MARTKALAKVLLDFDGTVTVKDTVDAILECFAAPAWREIEEEWKRGEIGSRECLAKQTALIRASPEEIDALIDGIEIDPGFDEFVAACKRLNIGVTIVSDGYRRSIERVLQRAGHALPSRSGVLTYEGRRRWKLESPVSRADCSSDSNTCKCMVANEAGVPKILVGDGRSDFCVANEADLVFAKGALLDHCVENGIEHRPIAGLSGAARLLGEFAARMDAKRAA